MQSHDIEKTPAADAGPSEAATGHDLSSSLTHDISKCLPTSDASNISVSSFSTATLGECQHLIPLSDDTSSALNIWDSITHVSQTHSNPSTSSILDPPANIDPSLLIRDKQNDGLSPYFTTTIDCGCSSPHVQIQTEAPGSFSSGKIKILSFGPNVTTPDPYANTLRVETVCTLAALYTLGMHVGITEELLCADESLLPFFRFSADSVDDMIKANMICTVQKIFQTLKPDLRPSSEQITIKHHPYIDILPFPTLRKNLIIHQGEVDEDEFFLDILTGLVCWGGAGIGRRDREESTGYASTGTPWDVRSWEARVWFSNKYWTLLGGEDGELVRQSEWWRSIRGEDTTPNMGLHS